MGRVDATPADVNMREGTTLGAALEVFRGRRQLRATKKKRFRRNPGRGRMSEQYGAGLPRDAAQIVPSEKLSASS